MLVRHRAGGVSYSMRNLCIFPRDVQWIVSYAYATRRAEGLNAARNILINSLPKFPREAIIYYSNLTEAQNFIKTIVVETEAAQSHGSSKNRR